MSLTRTYPDSAPMHFSWVRLQPPLIGFFGAVYEFRRRRAVRHLQRHLPFIQASR